MTLYASGVDAAATNFRCVLVNEGGEIRKEIRERAKGISGAVQLKLYGSGSAICLSRRFRFGTILARGDAMPLPEHLGKGQRVGITDHVGDLCY